jgi:AcrR family transcriptional regulator
MEKEDRRNLILDCAKDLFAFKGYHETSISDIIEKSSIARGTFYLYFNSKRAILSEIVDNALQGIVSTMKPIQVGPGIDNDAIMRQLRINLSHALAPLFLDDGLARIFVSTAEGIDPVATEKLTEFYKYITDWMQEALQEGQKLGIVRPCNTRITAISLVGILRGIIWAHAVGGEHIDYHETVEELTANVLRGIMTVERFPKT